MDLRNNTDSREILFKNFLSLFMIEGLKKVLESNALTDECNVWPFPQSENELQIIGYMIVAITFCLQPLMRYVCARLEGLSRLMAADAFILLSFFGTVNVWRGIWNLLDHWFIPGDKVLSCWITHVGCFIFLMLLNCSNSILVRGVYIDAEEDNGKCVVFPCHYLRLFFKVGT